MEGLFDYFTKPTQYKSTSGGTMSGGTYAPSPLDTAASSGNLTSTQAGSMLSNTPNLPTDGYSNNSLMGGITDTLSNRDLMTGIMGAGQLGLGLANYLSMKPVYEEQLKGLKQNRQFAQQDQARQDRTRKNFDQIL